MTENRNFKLGSDNHLCFLTLTFKHYTKIKKGTSSGSSISFSVCFEKKNIVGKFRRYNFCAHLRHTEIYMRSHFVLFS